MNVKQERTSVDRPFKPNLARVTHHLPVMVSNITRYSITSRVRRVDMGPIITVLTRAAYSKFITSAGQ